MKKSKLFIFVVLIALLVMILVPACVQKDNTADTTDKTPVYKISFIADGYTVKIVEWKEGTTQITLPDEPHKDNYEFVGWFLEDGTAFDGKINAPLTSNIRVIAKFSLIEPEDPVYTITFDTQGGSAVNPVKTSLLQSSPFTQLSGYDFTGWYTDISCEEQYKVDFPYAPKSDVTLYAGWKQKVPQTYTVNFDSMGGSPVQPIKGEFIESEPFTQKADYDFTGWYTDSSCEAMYKVEFPFYPSEDMTLYAGWKAVVYPELLSIDGFSKDGDVYTAETPCPSSQQSLDLSGLVNVSQNAEWALYRDKNCSVPVDGAILPLEFGDNTFYIKVFDEKYSNVYTLSIYRNQGYKVEVYLGGELANTIIVDAGATVSTDDLLPDMKIQKVYTDESMSQEWKESTPVNSDIKLYVQAYFSSYSINSYGTISLSGNTPDVPYDAYIPATVNGVKVRSLGDNLFRFDRYLRSVTFEEGLESLGTYCFSDCRSLTEVTLPDSLKTISGYAFFQCENLKKVVMGNNVTTIGMQAFKYCTSLTDVNISTSLEDIGTSAFAYCDLKSVTLPETINTVGYTVFEYNDNLTSVVIPDKVIDIQGSFVDNTAFFNDPANWQNGMLYIGKTLIKVSKETKSITLKEDTINIAGSACTLAGDLVSVTFNENQLKNICSGAFSNTKLATADLRDNVVKICNDAFYNTPALVNCKDSDGAVYFGKHLIKYEGTAAQYTVKEGTIAIADYAARNNLNINQITLPDSLKIVGDYAFELCYNLNKVIVSESSQLEHIGYASFRSTGIDGIYLPSTLRTIDDSAFGFCTNMVYVVIPADCEYVGDKAFNGIPDLDIYCEAQSQPDSWHKDWGYNNKTSHIYYYSETYKEGAWHYSDGFPALWS